VLQCEGVDQNKMADLLSGDGKLRFTDNFPRQISCTTSSQQKSTKQKELKHEKSQHSLQKNNSSDPNRVGAWLSFVFCQ